MCEVTVVVTVRFGQSSAFQADTADRGCPTAAPTPLAPAGAKREPPGIVRAVTGFAVATALRRYSVRSKQPGFVAPLLPPSPSRGGRSMVPSMSACECSSRIRAKVECVTFLARLCDAAAALLPNHLGHLNDRGGNRLLDTVRSSFAGGRGLGRHSLSHWCETVGASRPSSRLRNQRYPFFGEPFQLICWGGTGTGSLHGRARSSLAGLRCTRRAARFGAAVLSRIEWPCPPSGGHRLGMTIMSSSQRSSSVSQPLLGERCLPARRCM